MVQHNKAQPVIIVLFLGSGAVMGVPAHDERDMDFAHQNQLPVKLVIQSPTPDQVKEGTGVKCIISLQNY